MGDAATARDRKDPPARPRSGSGTAPGPRRARRPLGRRQVDTGRGRSGEALGALVIDGDDFYTGGTGALWDATDPRRRWTRVIDWRRQRKVLESLRRRLRATWRPYDWEADDGRFGAPCLRRPGRCRDPRGRLQRPSRVGRPPDPARRCSKSRTSPAGPSAAPGGRAATGPSGKPAGPRRRTSTSGRVMPPGALRSRHR